MQYLIIVVYIILSVTGVVLVKRGAGHPLNLGIGGGLFSLTFGYVTLLGLLCYVCSFLIYMSLVAKYDLSYIVPLSAGGIYLLTYAASIGIFHEKVNVTRVIGSAVILAGIVLVSWKE
jgi:multidrug transporter EmrE-like cation transporter